MTTRERKILVHANKTADAMVRVGLWREERSGRGFRQWAELAIRNGNADRVERIAEKYSVKAAEEAHRQEAQYRRTGKRPEDIANAALGRQG